MLGFSLAPSRRSGTLSRVVYEDDRILEQGRSFAERAYGACVHVVSTRGAPPARPVALPGIVVHLDPIEDARWVQGRTNPMLDYLALKDRLGSLFSVGDIDDKWYEYRFVKAAAPDAAPPRMELVARYARAPIHEDERRRATAAVKRALAGRTRIALSLIEELVRLEVLRTRMHADLGRALLKVRDLNHSEGKLPSTDGDWIGLYLSYLAETKTAIDRLRDEVEGSCATLESRITDLPHVSGRVLELLLRKPERVVVQGSVRIAKEVRVHVVEGKVLTGATFLRFYPLGGYLTEAEIAAVEATVQRHLIDRLPGELARFSCSSDVLIEEGTGAIRILDLNAGIESGYYYPEEDVLTTNLLAERLTGRRTPLLEEFDGVMAAHGRRRAERLGRLVAGLEPVLSGDVLEAFWDRVLVHHVRAITRDPRPEALAGALEELAQAGVPRASIVHQLIAQVQDAHPAIELPREQARRWAGWLNELEPDVATYVSEGRLYATLAEAKRRHTRARPALPHLIPLPVRG